MYLLTQQNLPIEGVYETIWKEYWDVWNDITSGEEEPTVDEAVAVCGHVVHGAGVQISLQFVC